MEKSATRFGIFFRKAKAWVPAPLKYYLVGRWRTPREHEFFTRRLVSKTIRQLQDIFRQGDGLTIWFLPHTSWFSPAFQRSHQLARAFAKVGCRVLCYEPWFHNTELAIPAGDRGNRFVGVRQVAAGVYLLRCPEELFRIFASAVNPDALMMCWSWQGSTIPGEGSSVLVYETVDDYSLYPDPDGSLAELHRRWVGFADVVTATSDLLREQLAAVRDDVLLLPNGVNPEDWKASGTPQIPPDMRRARRAAVVVGFCGTISTWFDWDLWNSAAQSHPSWSFVLVGKGWRVGNSDIAARVEKQPNMYWLGSKPYGAVPSYVSNFDVATIPFILDPVTHACSPIKLFEYTAAGKPVVATPMKEILKYKSVYFADTAREFARQLEVAAAARNDTDYQRLLREESQANTWRARAEALCKAIASARQRQGSVPRRHAGQPEEPRGK